MKFGSQTPQPEFAIAKSCSCKLSLPPGK